MTLALAAAEGKKILAKNAPPYRAELDLGKLPKRVEVRAGPEHVNRPLVERVAAVDRVAIAAKGPLPGDDRQRAARLRGGDGSARRGDRRDRPSR